jgi:hypothetical protein
VRRLRWRERRGHPQASRHPGLPGCRSRLDASANVDRINVSDLDGLTPGPDPDRLRKIFSLALNILGRLNSQLPPDLQSDLPQFETAKVVDRAPTTSSTSSRQVGRQFTRSANSIRTLPGSQGVGAIAGPQVRSGFRSAITQAGKRLSGPLSIALFFALPEPLGSQDACDATGCAGTPIGPPGG